MFKSLKKAMKSQAGEAGSTALGIMTIIFIVLALLVLAITVLGAYIKVHRMQIIAGEIIRVAEIKGHTDIDTEVENILNNSGFNPDEITVSFECDYIPGTKRVQLGGNMKVTVETTAKIGVGEIAVIEVPLRGKAVGVSEEYWK